MTLDYATYTNAGGREYNEDAVGVYAASWCTRFVVADGLGGHRNGAEAARTVVKAVAEGDRMPLPTLMESAQEAVLTLQKETNGRMKSTAVVLEVEGKEARWANVGDSRLYYLRQGLLCRVTQDHSVAYKKYKAGEITRAQIAADEDQSQLLRALGSDHGQADLDSAEIEPGDGFLLCSDGLWEYVTDQEICVDFLKADSAQTWSKLLLLRLMERLEPDSDNLSLITVIVSEDEKQEGGSLC